MDRVFIFTVAGAPLTPPVQPAAKTPPIPKQQAKKPAMKVAAVKRLMKKGLFAAINAAAVAAMPDADGDHAHKEFVDLPERYTFSLFFPI
jgi:hypothetical protein